MSMSPFLKRTLSGIMLVTVMISLILSSVDTLLILALAIAAATIPEYFRLTFPHERGFQGMVRHFNTIFVSWLMIFATYQVVWNRGPLEWYLMVLPLIFLLVVFNIFNRYDASPAKRIGTELSALLYIGLPMSLLVALGVQTGPEGNTVYNAWIVLFYVILIWINDVGAYLVGVTFGKHRLIERISPKKSWEGFFGGLVLTVIGAVVMGPAMTRFQNIPWAVWIIFGVVLTLSAVAGDLVESMLKREAGVKDSGNTIPGHGGFLDRFDAMLISLPFVYTMIRLMAAGQME